MELVHFWGQLLFWLRAGSSPCRASQGCIVCANKLKRTATWSTQVNKEHKCVSSSYPAFALLSASRGQKTQQTREGNPHPSHAASAAVLHGFTETTVPHFHTTRRQDFMCLQHQMYFAASAGGVRRVLSHLRSPPVRFGGFCRDETRDMKHMIGMGLKYLSHQSVEEWRWLIV